jgi:hypothetical protein
MTCRDAPIRSEDDRPVAEGLSDDLLRRGVPKIGRRMEDQATGPRMQLTADSAPGRHHRQYRAGYQHLSRAQPQEPVVMVPLLGVGVPPVHGEEARRRINHEDLIGRLQSLSGTLRLRTRTDRPFEQQSAVTTSS